MRNGHVDRQGSRGRGSLRGARAVGRALRGHVITGNLGGEGGRKRERARQAGRPPATVLVGAGCRTEEEEGGEHQCMCVSFSNHLRRSAVEVAATASVNCGSPRLFFPLFLDSSSSPTPCPRRAGPLPASRASSLGLLGTRCFLSGQGLRRCGCLSPLAALPLLATRSRDWSGDLLAQTDSERATACALPHRGNGRAGAQGQGGGDEEDEASETLNLGKVQGLCRSPQRRRGSVRGGAGHPSAETATPYRRGKKGVVGCCRGLTIPSPILQRLRAGYWRRRSGKKRLELGRLSWRFRSFA